MTCCQACKSSELIAALCADHRNFLDILERLSRLDDPRSKELQQFVEDSNKHHAEEERSVIPVLVATGYGKVATILLVDHQILKAKKAELMRSRSGAEARIRLRSLLADLKKHIAYEAKIAFPCCVKL